MLPADPREDSAAAFREAYERHVRSVWRVLFRLGVPERDLPDAAQEVFLVVARRLPEFEPHAKLMTWIFAICRRVASDRRQLAHARRELAASHLPTCDFPGTPWPHEESPLDADALIDRRRARAVLESILERMPETQRIVFTLFELDGLSGEEIASALNLRVGTVRSRLRLARDLFERSVQRWRCQAGEARPVSLRTREA